MHADFEEFNAQTWTNVSTPEEATDLLLRTVQRIRKPAGHDPRFSSLQSIREHPVEFFIAANKNMRELHKLATSMLMWADRGLKEIDPVSPEGQEILRNRLFWQHVNNHLAWMCLKDRHVIRRLCGFKTRPALEHANGDSVLAIIDDIMDNEPRLFAMWTDATSFIDVGDVLVHSPLDGSYRILEAKQWGDYVWTFGSDAPKEHLQTYHEAAEKDIGPEAIKKAERLNKQLSRMRKIEGVLSEDTGVDPFQNLPVILLESTIPERHFDSDLSEAMAEARDKGYALKMIDRCLYIGAYYDHNPIFEAAFAASAAAEFSSSPDNYSELLESGRMLRETQHYTMLAGHPLARPIFLSALTDEEVLDVITGKATLRMFFHWESWGELFEPFGGKLIWMTKKEFRQVYGGGDPDRAVVSEGRVPSLAIDGVVHPFTPHQMIRMFTDFLSPSFLAELFLESATLHAPMFHAQQADK